MSHGNTAMVVNLTAGDGIYKNNGLVGQVNLSYFASLAQISPNDLAVRIRSRLQNLEGTTINTITKTHDIIVTTSSIQGNFQHQFEILSDGSFPEELKLVLNADVLAASGVITNISEFEFIVNFTGDQPTLTPTGQELALNFDFTKIFELRAGNLAGTIEVGKQPAWKEAFNSRQLVMFVKVVDLSNSQTIRLEQFPFVIGTNIFHFQDISFSQLPSNVRLEAFVWDTNDIAFAPTITHIFNDVDPPIVTDQILVTAIAQNGFQIGGTVTAIDFNKLNDPIIGVSSVSATISGEPTNLNISATFDSIMAFLIANQVIEPLPECPEGFHKPLGFVNCIAIDQNNPPPNSQFCDVCQLWILDTESCATCQPVEPSNVCFTLLYRDNSEDSWTLTNENFEALIANPVSTGICAPIVKNISDCTTLADDLGIVRNDIFNKVNQCLDQPPEDDVTVDMVSISAGGFIITPDDRIKGTVLLVANTSFNPFWYGKNILLLTQIKNESGQVIQIKENNLNFTETERDETIIIDETAQGLEKIIIEFFVLVSLTDPRRFADPQSIIVTKEGSTIPPNGGGLTFGSGGVLSKVVGGFFGLLTLCLLTEKGRK